MDTNYGTVYYLTDNLGSIVGLVNSIGTVLAQYAYDPAGNTRAVTGDLAWVGRNPYGYAAGYTTPGTGLTKFGARYYDPNTGRFTQQDPSGQETNLYAYVADNPVNRVDPTGLLSLGSVLHEAGKIAIGAAIGGLSVGAGGCVAGLIIPGPGTLAGCVAGFASGFVAGGVGVALTDSIENPF